MILSTTHFLWARHRNAKCFPCVIAFNPHCNSMTKERDPEILFSLPKLENVRARI